MDFVPASLSATAERNVFINHNGAYWLNPVPYGTRSEMRSHRVVVGAADAIDPFGRIKQHDMPKLFGVSRYGSNEQRRGEETTAQGDIGATQDGDKENTNRIKQGGYLERTKNGGDGTDTFALRGENLPLYSVEDLLKSKLPLGTAYPEKRVIHPGNHEERIQPTGGSEYNGVVSEPWAVPREADNTYLRLAPLYESSTHYQQRTGRFYTEDEAPPHKMKLPPKNTLPKREW